jgi:rod shape-determining protein MreD
MNKGGHILRQFIHLISYLALQLIFSQSVVAIYHAQCFIYVGIFLLWFPQRTNLPLQLLLAFAFGMMMDAFYDTLGIHAFASVLIVYVKAFLSKILLPTSSSTDMQPSLSSLGFKKFSVFVLLLLFVHHAAVFLLEACNSELFILTMQKALLSTLFTYLVICSMQAISGMIISKNN